MVDSLLLTHVVDSFDCTYAVINLRGCSLARFVTRGVCMGCVVVLFGDILWRVFTFCAGSVSRLFMRIVDS